MMPSQPALVSVNPMGGVFGGESFYLRLESKGRENICKRSGYECPNQGVKLVFVHCRYGLQGRLDYFLQVRRGFVPIFYGVSVR
jgi:hypothetical protein